MNTKIWLTSSSLTLGLVGIFALFTPENLMALFNAPPERSLFVLIQLLGALYFSFALMNWTAKDSAIGGIYARAVSLGNFSHFFSGTLLLSKYLLSDEFKLPVLLMWIIYAIFTIFFYWLVFRATGLKA